MKWTPLLLLAAACFPHSYKTSRPPSADRHTLHAEYFFWGLIGEEHVYLDELCPHGVASFTNTMELTDGLLDCLTCGIYSPRTIEVVCAEGGSFALTPDPAAGVTWVEALAEGRADGTQERRTRR